jgi:hypothetical protein
LIDSLALPTTTLAILQAFESRISWPIMREVLQELDFPDSGHGWDATRKKYLAELEEGAELEKLNLLLLKKFEEFLLVGESVVRIRKVTDENQFLSLYDLLGGFQPEETSYSSVFPLPLDEEDLDKVDGEAHVVNVKQTESQLVLTFCSKRSVKTRFTVPHEDVTQKLRPNDKVYMERMVVRQFFDCVVLDNVTREVEYRTEYGPACQTGYDEYEAYKSIRRKFVEIADNVLGEHFGLDTEINFENILKKIYVEEGDGEICELGFVTLQGTNNHEKVRRQKMDIRSDEYHKGGSSAVNGDIQPYCLGCIWTRYPDEPKTAQPELFIPGEYRKLILQGFGVHKILIRKCRNREDFEDVMSKVRLYLKDSSAAE